VAQSRSGATVGVPSRLVAVLLLCSTADCSRNARGRFLSRLCNYSRRVVAYYVSEQQSRRRLSSRLDALSQETRLVIKKKKTGFHSLLLLRILS
jgi:hypothetical protein